MYTYTRIINYMHYIYTPIVFHIAFQSPCDIYTYHYILSTTSLYVHYIQHIHCKYICIHGGHNSDHLSYSGANIGPSAVSAAAGSVFSAAGVADSTGSLTLPPVKFEPPIHVYAH